MYWSFIRKVAHPVSDRTQPCLTSVKLMELAGPLGHSPHPSGEGGYFDLLCFCYIYHKGGPKNGKCDPKYNIVDKICCSNIIWNKIKKMFFGAPSNLHFE